MTRNTWSLLEINPKWVNEESNIVIIWFGRLMTRQGYPFSNGTNNKWAYRREMRKKREETLKYGNEVIKSWRSSIERITDMYLILDTDDDNISLWCSEMRCRKLTRLRPIVDRQAWKWTYNTLIEPCWLNKSIVKGMTVLCIYYFTLLSLY